MKSFSNIKLIQQRRLFSFLWILRNDLTSPSHFTCAVMFILIILLCGSTYQKFTQSSLGRYLLVCVCCSSFKIKQHKNIFWISHSKIEFSKANRWFFHYKDLLTIVLYSSGVWLKPFLKPIKKGSSQFKSNLSPEYSHQFCINHMPKSIYGMVIYGG